MKRKRTDEVSSLKNKKRRRYNECFDILKSELNYVNHRLEEMRKERDYIDGTKRLKEFLYFGLVLVSKTYPQTELQFEIFLKFIPTCLPSFYGKGFYKMYKDELHEMLGTLHKKLFLWFKGSRRDGKSILQAICGAGMFCTCTAPGDNMFFPFLGPSENTGMRINANIQSILNLPDVQTKYFKNNNLLPPKKSQKTLRIYDKKNKCSKQGQALAPTDKALRGINSTHDLGDEGEWFPFGKFETLCIPRYKQEGVPAFWITTPNPNALQYRQFDKSSDVVESVNKSRICRYHLENLHEYNNIREAMLDCQKKGHVKPPNVPWISDELDSGWSKYQSSEAFAAERLGEIMSSNFAQFHVKDVDKLFIQRDVEPLNGYHSFHVGCDPSDKGKSETAVWILGYKNDIFHIVYGNSYLVKDEQNVEDLIFKDIEFFLLNSNVLKKNCYIWIESFGHHGSGIQNRCYHNGFIKYAKVMKGINIKNKNELEWRFGIPKTKDATESYTSRFRTLLNSNRIKIWEGFFTQNKGGDVFMLNKLKKQMLNYVRDENGKLTGKLKGENDDCLIATIMIPDNFLKALNPLHPYNRQLNFQDELFTF